MMVSHVEGHRFHFTVATFHFHYKSLEHLSINVFRGIIDYFPKTVAAESTDNYNDTGCFSRHHLPPTATVSGTIFQVDLVKANGDAPISGIRQHLHLLSQKVEWLLAAINNAISGLIRTQVVRLHDKCKHKGDKNAYNLLCNQQNIWRTWCQVCKLVTFVIYQTIQTTEDNQKFCYLNPYRNW